MPLEVRGSRASSLRFARRLPAGRVPERPTAIVIVPRWIAQLTPLGQDSLRAAPLGHAVWDNTSLLPDTWVPRSLRDLFTGRLWHAGRGPAPDGCGTSGFSGSGAFQRLTLGRGPYMAYCYPPRPLPDAK